MKRFECVTKSFETLKMRATFSLRTILLCHKHRSSKSINAFFGPSHDPFGDWLRGVEYPQRIALCQQQVPEGFHSNVRASPPGTLFDSTRSQSFSSNSWNFVAAPSPVGPAPTIRVET